MEFTGLRNQLDEGTDGKSSWHLDFGERVNGEDINSPRQGKGRDIAVFRERFF